MAVTPTTKATGVAGPWFHHCHHPPWGGPALRYGFPPEASGERGLTNARDQHTDTSWTVGRRC